MLNHNLLDHLAATVRIYGDTGIEIGVGGAAFAHRWELPRKGGGQDSEGNNRPSTDKPKNLKLVVSWVCST